MKKLLTNVTTGSLFINWCYKRGDKVRSGSLILKPFEVKECDFIDANDYNQMVKQNDDLFATGKLIDNKKSDSKKDQTIENNEKEEYKRLKDNSGIEDKIEQQVTDDQGNVVGNVKTDVKEA